MNILILTRKNAKGLMMNTNRKRLFLFASVAATLFFSGYFAGTSDAADPGWSPVAGTLSMEIYGEVYINGEKIETPGYVIAAFGNDGAECRARGNIRQIFGEWGYHFTINGFLEGETISFKVWDAGKDRQYFLEDTIPFQRSSFFKFNIDILLSIDSVYPTMGKIGQDLEVEIQGTGFDSDTRFSFYPDTGNKKAFVGMVDTPNYASAVAVSGELAFVSDTFGGLQVVDISFPSDPISIGHVDTPGSALGIFVSGNLVYVADGEGGLQIVDISDPENPSVIGNFSTTEVAQDVIVFRNLAFVANGEGGLAIIDVTDPENPFSVGVLDTPSRALKLAFENDLVFIATFEAGLQIVDVRNPSNPVLLGKVDTPGEAYDVAVSGELAFIADYDQGLQVVDISNPVGPLIIGQVDTTGYCMGIEVSGDQAFLADGYRGIRAVDISIPTAPVIVGAANSSGIAVDVAISENLAYIACYSEGLSIFDTGKLDSGLLMANVDIPNEPKKIFLSGNLAYVTNREGLYIVEISEPENPKIIGTLLGQSDCGDVFVSDDVAYVANRFGGGSIIDVSDPRSPFLIDFENTGMAESVFISKGLAYVASSDYGLHIIDITNPRNVNLIGHLDTPGFLKDVFVVDNTAYLAATDAGIQVVDVSNHAEPVIIGSLEEPSRACYLSVSGDYAFATDTDSFFVLDVSNPREPSLLNEFKIPGYTEDFVVSERLAFVACGYSGIYTIDVENPTKSVLIGVSSTPFYAYDVACIDNTAFIVDLNAGMVVAPLPVEVSPTLKSDSQLALTIPSPQMEGNYTLRVFDEKEYSELIGGLSFKQNPGTSKAIIVAGGGPYQGNFIWEDTKLNANFAYQALLYQGYRKENIMYLCAEPVDIDGDGEIDVDGVPSLGNVEYAVKTWAMNPPSPGEPADELFVFFTDHGGVGTFRLDEESVLTAETLDSWLDELQVAMPGKVVFVIDACYSGSFLSAMTAPVGKERICIASTGTDEKSVFLEKGRHTFGYQFWASVFSGGTLGESFFFGRKMMQEFQTAQLDANSNGTAMEKSDKLRANEIKIGRGYKPASDIPFIKNVSEDMVLNGETSASFYASEIVDANAIVEVRAVIDPPSRPEPADDSPIWDLPAVTLADEDGDGAYQGLYDGFTQEGVYTVSVYARDSDGMTSLPQTFTVTQTQGTSTVDFSATPTKGVVPLTVSFSGESTGEMTTWAWGFGDGATGSGQNVVHEYTVAGTYTVALAASGPEGSDSKTRTAYIQAEKHQIKGRVAASFFGHESIGVANAEVAVEGFDLTTVTDENGDFCLELPDNFPAGSHQLTITSPDLQTQTVSVDVLSDKSLEIGEIPALPQVGTGCTQQELDDAVLVERDRWDANGDNKKGLQEAVEALRTVSGLQNDD